MKKVTLTPSEEAYFKSANDIIPATTLRAGAEAIQKCPRCPGGELTVQFVQTRSMDEGQSQLITCANCSYLKKIR